MRILEPNVDRVKGRRLRRKLRRQERPRDALDILTSDDVLLCMSYYEVLKWATGGDGVFLSHRLRRIARVRDYSGRWVKLNTGKTFMEVWGDVMAYVADNPRRR